MKEKKLLLIEHVTSSHTREYDVCILLPHIRRRNGSSFGRSVFIISQEYNVYISEIQIINILVSIRVRLNFMYLLIIACISYTCFGINVDTIEAQQNERKVQNSIELLESKSPKIESLNCQNRILPYVQSSGVASIPRNFF